MNDVRVSTHDEVERLYRAEGDRLWWAVLAYAGDREIASDAVAEAFAQALRSGERIRSPLRWVWRVAFRLAAAELKERRRVGPLPDDAADEIDERPAAVLAALARLSPRQRAALVLHYYAGCSTKEAASILGSTPATVAVHLHRGRKRLRELLEDRDE